MYSVVRHQMALTAQVLLLMFTIKQVFQRLVYHHQASTMHLHLYLHHKLAT